MIASEATISYQRPPFIYGEILSLSAYAPDTPEQSERPGIGRFLSQGAAAGAVMAFLAPLFVILTSPGNGYNFLVVFLLPFYLAIGMAIGLLPGLVIWGCTRLAGHQLSRIPRAAIGVLICGALLGVFYFVFPTSPYSETPELKDYLSAIGIQISTGVAYGLVTGSRLQPWRALVRGLEPAAPGSRLLTGITGLILRAAVVFFVMESILALTCTLQRDFWSDEFVFALIALGHFTAALLIVSIRLPFWLLLPLALIVNVPIFSFVTDVLGKDNVLGWYFTVSYLAVWAAFLIARWRPTYSALAFINKEIRYYLID